MTVLVIDDHPIVQQGLARTLTDEFPGSEIGLASSANEALALFAEKPWTLVILDLSLPDRSGLELIREMKQVNSKVLIVVLTLHAEDRFAVRAFRAGADGYLTKQCSPQNLGEAIRKVLGGGKYVTASLGEKLASYLARGESDESHELLSDREYQVLGLLANGKSIGSIASELHLSPNTISTYRSRILEKLHLESTAELIAYAIRHHIAE